ncbi:glycine zipper 2TM domain-containing protein [Aquisalimonas lutea]|uniref:glycine zipper 2TM domain-containing protein n=1 Tax=Aquisalimonas lutea TaxID=1327750 RepID=UPI0025B6041F|nr:glycine zipper 2TM domain-containing protein [Aquisalimonas lutea]MDN3516271.1 glycine zipper 2TM domain-containing protein [Aquisalimonas lutea]
MSNRNWPRNALASAALVLALAGLTTPALAKGPPSHAAAPAHAATAHHGDRHGFRSESRRYSDYARVVEVQPVYREVRVSQPRRECHDERVVHRHREGPGEAGSAIIGGIVGGIIGHQIGDGRGRDAATAIGAVAGTAAGSHFARSRGRTVERTGYETVCRTVDEVHYEERVDGYDVTYRYDGREYTTRMNEDPGRHIRVRVGVDPVR